MALNQRYNALITDLDGSAVKISSDGSDVTSNSRLAIRNAQAAGKHIGCATGRRWTLAEPVVRALGLTAPSILEGGSLIVDSVTGTTLWEQYLDAHVPAQILGIFKRYADGGIVSTSADEIRRQLADMSEAPDRARFMYLLGTDPATAQRICEAIGSQGLAAAHTTPSWLGEGRYDIHVTHPEATKKHAVRVWQTMQDVTQAETIGFADSMNDVPLFESVGMRVAVETAAQPLIELADHIAPSPANDGLAYVIENFLNPDRQIQDIG